MASRNKLIAGNVIGFGLAAATAWQVAEQTANLHDAERRIAPIEQTISAVSSDCLDALRDDFYSAGQLPTEHRVAGYCKDVSPETTDDLFVAYTEHATAENYRGLSALVGSLSLLFTFFGDALHVRGRREERESAERNQRYRG